MSKLLEPHPVGSVNDSCHVLDCSQTTENINAASTSRKIPRAGGGITRHARPERRDCRREGMLGAVMTASLWRSGAALERRGQVGRQLFPAPRAG